MTAVLYWIAQFSGAILGAVLTVELTGHNSQVDYGHCHGLSTIEGDTGETFGWEFFATFMLVWVVHATAVSKPSIAPGTAPFGMLRLHLEALECALSCLV